MLRSEIQKNNQYRRSCSVASETRTIQVSLIRIHDSKRYLLENKKKLDKSSEFFRCYVCKKESTTIIALRAHLRVHENRSYAQQNRCEICSKSFFGNHHFKRHLKISHGIGNLEIVLMPEKRKKNSNALIQFLMYQTLEKETI